MRSYRRGTYCSVFGYASHDYAARAHISCRELQAGSVGAHQGLHNGERSGVYLCMAHYLKIPGPVIAKITRDFRFFVAFRHDPGNTRLLRQNRHTVSGSLVNMPCVDSSCIIFSVFSHQRNDSRSREMKVKHTLRLCHIAARSNAAT